MTGSTFLTNRLKLKMLINSINHQSAQVQRLQSINTLGNDHYAKRLLVSVSVYR